MLQRLSVATSRRRLWSWRAAHHLPGNAAQPLASKTTLWALEILQATSMSERVASLSAPQTVPDRARLRGNWKPLPGPPPTPHRHTSRKKEVQQSKEEEHTVTLYEIRAIIFLYQKWATCFPHTHTHYRITSHESVPLTSKITAAHFWAITKKKKETVIWDMLCHCPTP